MNGNQLAWTLSAIGAGMGGWERGKMLRQEMDEEKADQDFKQQQRARMQQQWARDDQVRSELANAAQPVTVQENPAPPNPDTTLDDGTVIRERPLPDTYTITAPGPGGRPRMQAYGPDGTAARAYADDQNRPDQQLMRQADAVQGIDPQLASQLRAQSLKLSAEMRQDIDDRFGAHVNGANTFDELAQIINDAKVDGMAGALKVDLVNSPDGQKVGFVKVKPDGSMVATPYHFDNNADGLEAAKLMLSRLTTPLQKLSYVHQKHQEQFEQKQLDERAKEHSDDIAAENARASRQRQTQLEVAGLVGPDGKPISIDERDAATVDQIGNYKRAPLPTGRGGRNVAIMDAVSKKYPNFDQTQYGARQKAASDFAAGQSGRRVQSFNTMIDHTQTLLQLADALKNGNTPLFNRIANNWAAQTGAAEPTNFDAAKQIVGNEIVKSILGTGGTDDDRKAALKVLDDARTPAQMSGAIATIRRMAAGQLKGLERQYKAGTRLDDFQERFLTDEAKGVLGSLSRGSNGSKAAGAVPRRVSTEAEYNALPSGTVYVGPDGQQRRKK